MKGKGVVKTRRTLFRRGHEFYAPYSKNPSKEGATSKTEITEEITDEQQNWRRLTKKRMKKAVQKDDQMLPLDADGNLGAAKYLRPAKDTGMAKTEEYLKTRKDGKGENIIVNETKLYEMWNDCMLQHSIQSPDCQPAKFEINRRLGKGAALKESVKCLKCSFISDIYKLYDEVHEERRGAKTAAINLGLGVGLMESTIGPHKGRVILASSNIRPPSKSSMYKTANKVGAKTATMTHDDLKRRRAEVSEINKDRGLNPKSPINIAIDVRYNSNTITGSYKMGPNASQAIGVAIEQQTDERNILAIDVRNQLCPKGKSLRRRGADVTCPGHIGCTANTGENETLSEYKIGEEIGNAFAREGVPIKHVTTDGDGRSADGVAAAFARVDPKCQVIRQADTTHLEQSLFRQIIKHKFSAHMFPGLKGKATFEDKKKQRKNFGLDVKCRSHKVYNLLFRYFKGDLARISDMIPKTIEAILECYSGNHRRCARNFTACQGGKSKGNWWFKSVQLHSAGIYKLNMSAEDRQFLKTVLEMKLSPESIKLQKNNTNTNKNEAVNRGISASLPKNVKFSRNVVGRAFAVVDRTNYGPGESLLRKLESVGAQISKGGPVAKAVKGFQDEKIYQRSYKRKKAVQNRGLKQKAEKIKAHYIEYTQRKEKAKKDRYRKNQIDPKPKLKRTTKKIRSQTKLTKSNKITENPTKNSETTYIKFEHNYYGHDIANLTTDTDSQAFLLCDQDTWDHSYSMYF
jgi:hypothetical protein